ncbi:protein Dia1p [Monosporozyma servazzii]
MGKFSSKEEPEDVKHLQETTSSIVLSNHSDVSQILRFNKVRQMPIIKWNNKIGYYMFPSLQSYDYFKNNDKEIILNEDGVGIPLFYFEPCQYTTYNADNASEKINYQLYIFVMQRADDPPPFEYESIEVSNEYFKLYKCLYAIISKTVKWFKTIFKMTLREARERPYHFIYKNYKLDVMMDDYVIRWADTYNMFKDTGYKSYVVPLDQKSLFDSADDFKSDTPYSNRELILKKRRETEKEAPEPMIYPFDTHDVKEVSTIKDSKNFIGRYTLEGAGGFSNKMAIVYVGEYGPLNSFGICNIPSTTKLLACQAFLLHRIEVEKQQERNRNAYRGASGLYF